MKCSEYLWKRLELNSTLPDLSPEQLQGVLGLITGNEKIVSDTTGKIITEREANSIYGRQYAKLNAAFKDNDKEYFINICTEQINEDDEYESSNK